MTMKSGCGSVAWYWICSEHEQRAVQWVSEEGDWDAAMNNYSTDAMLGHMGQIKSAWLKLTQRGELRKQSVCLHVKEVERFVTGKLLAIYIASISVWACSKPSVVFASRGSNPAFWILPCCMTLSQCQLCLSENWFAKILFGDLCLVKCLPSEKKESFVWKALKQIRHFLCFCRPWKSFIWSIWESDGW